MTKNIDSSRREFLANTGKLMVGEALLSLPAASATARPRESSADAPSAVPKSSQEISEFLYGASVYPELQTRAQWNAMLDHFQRAHMTCVRVSESSWGNLETARGVFEFGWLHDFLDDLHQRKMKAILGTGSYVPPQWLAAENPEILIQLHAGVPAHPMARHAPCLSHPLYRQALREYILAIGREFKGHPTVIGWQLGNEEEGTITRMCHNPACEKAWREWLKKTYHTPEEFNQRLDLVSWGMKVRLLDEVPQPDEGVEESGQQLAALTLAHRHFRRDVLLGFFAIQAAALREAGVQQWILTDWNLVWHAAADDPQAGEIMDIAGLNYYQHHADNANFWSQLAWHQDMHRSAYGRKHFITTESRVGVAGGTHIGDPCPTQEQFRMWGLGAAALGSCGLLYWSGNRWRGGHWPHWGGLLDWSEHPEPDFGWSVELGAIFAKWGKHLIDNPVKATAVVLTDFEQRAALEIYPHIQSSLTVLPETFEAFHRLGIGVDSMNLRAAAEPSHLKKYSLVWIPAATALDNAEVVAALQDFAQGGGVIVITPFTAYTDENGIFRGDGFAANLRELAGGLVRTIRWMGSNSALSVEWKGGGGAVVAPVPQNAGPAHAALKGGATSAAAIPKGGATSAGAALKGGAAPTGFSSVGLDGYCEFLEVDSVAVTIARFKCDQPILDGRPAATQRDLGHGRVVKLAFWPGDDHLLRLIRQLAPQRETLLAAPVAKGVLAVPRADKSLFVVNTTGHEMPIQLARGTQDRLTATRLSPPVKLKPFQVLWLE